MDSATPVGLYCGIWRRRTKDIIRQRANFTNLCHPVVTETEEGRRRCAYSSDEFRQALPQLWTSLHTLLHRWESSGLATRADLGRGLRLDPEHDRVARLIHVTTPTTTPDIRDRYFAGWHVDNHGVTAVTIFIGCG